MPSNRNLEKQIRTLYVCEQCGRRIRLAKYKENCPYCGGRLIAKTVAEKPPGGEGRGERFSSTRGQRRENPKANNS